MNIKTYNELVFRITYSKVTNKEFEDNFVYNFVDNFAAKNNWFIAGSIKSGFILYDEKNKTDLTYMRKKLISYLKRQKSLKIIAVIFQSYNSKIENSDFINVEKIILNMQLS